jgi:GNAT superfamily N-acetyltransferase
VDNVAIRPLALADHAEWRTLWDGYNAFYGRSGATALPDDVSRTTWTRLLDPHEPMHALVAERNSALVGLAQYLFHRSTTAIADTCYLQDLFTATEARGRGVASALIAVVCERARAAGAQRVYWQTHETNATAQRLYDRVAERSGFIVYRIALDDRVGGG